MEHHQAVFGQKKISVSLKSGQIIAVFGNKGFKC